MHATVKKLIASATLATTLGVGAFATTGVVAGAASPTPTTAAAAQAPAKAKPGKQLRRQFRREAITSAAHTIGIPRRDLVAQLKAGRSVAEVATAHGVAPQKVVDAWVSAGDKAIDKAVAAGHLTPQRAAKLKARLPKLAARLVNAHRHAH
ncbi:MAG: hypothetical protein JWN46_828 [Acidimicrobiales bacterium]|nr:hypothetical protein [Acidimicrobiales bacterium]